MSQLDLSSMELIPVIQFKFKIDGYNSNSSLIFPKTSNSMVRLSLLVCVVARWTRLVCTVAKWQYLVSVECQSSVRAWHFNN